MKGFALVGQDKPKDARDIYVCVKNYPGGPVGMPPATGNIPRPGNAALARRRGGGIPR